MALARVVSFEDVDGERIAEVRRQIESDPRPEDVPASEVVMLHDPDAAKSLVILFFESEEDFRRGDATLNAMTPGEVPGRRTSVEKYQVALRKTV